MNTDRKVRKKNYYSVRYPGDPVWNPLEHITYIRLDEKDSEMMKWVQGKPVVIEKSRKREERVELRRLATIEHDVMWDVIERKPQLYQNLTPYWRSREGMKELTWQNDECKNLSVISANTDTIGRPFANTEIFHCYDITNGPSDEELIWKVEPKIAKRLIRWFSMEHFDLSITKYGTEYDIKPIHNYYRRSTHISDKA